MIRKWQDVNDINRLTNEGSRLIWLEHLARNIAGGIGGSPDPNDRWRNEEAVRLAEAFKGDERIGDDFPTWIDDHYRDMLADMVCQACRGPWRVAA